MRRANREVERMALDRRYLFRAAAALPLLGVAAETARADTTDLALLCDRPLAPVLESLKVAFRAQSGVEIFFFPTSPALILPQLQREVQIDLVVTTQARLQEGVMLNVVAPNGGSRVWRNRLVVAGMRGADPRAGAVAVPDAVPGWDIDSGAALAAAGVKPARIIGGANTAEVWFLLISGAASAGLMHVTELRADPRLEMVASVPDDAYAPILYAAAATPRPRRPHPEAFLAFVATPAAQPLLTASGLEVVA
jgi:molybdate transport system substrate-binding protein